MTYWKRLVAKMWSIEPWDLTVGEPALAEEITALEREVGGVLPTSLKNMYCEFNGAAYQCGDHIDWIVMPIDKIVALSNEVRRTFESTHAGIAWRFVAFMDHGNGDATGYLMPAYDDSSDGFMVFEHEAVGFDESQDWREFLLHRASLEDCFS